MKRDIWFAAGNDPITERFAALYARLDEIDRSAEREGQAIRVLNALRLPRRRHCDLDAMRRQTGMEAR